MIEAALLGLSLSMDAFAVSVGAGVGIAGLKKRHIFRAALFFGLFQFFMPLAGWALGSAVLVYIQAFDHWVAFGLLSFIGGKMIREAFTEKDKTAGDIRKLSVLFLLALATSIDALAAGVSFSVTGHNIVLSASIIGAVTFSVCLSGFEFGRRVGLLFEKGAQIAGGIVLMALGAKILLEHLR